MINFVYDEVSMCGIFGAVQNSPDKSSYNDFVNLTNKLFKLSESRGREASGITLVAGENSNIEVLKSMSPASRLIKSKEYKGLFKNFYVEAQKNKKPCLAMGHTRLVTNGSHADKNNNQPVSYDGGVVIHNGIIVNVDDLWAKHTDLQRKTGVDTEIVIALIRKYFKETQSPVEAVNKAFSEIYGTASIALAFEDINVLVIATNNGSLYTAESKDTTIFASERHTLLKLMESNAITDKSEFEIKPLLANEGLLVDLDSGKRYEFKIGDNNTNSIETKVSNSNKVINTHFYSDGTKRDSVFDIKKVTVPQEFEIMFSKVEERVDNLKRCTKCVLPETMPFIEFNAEGICNFCTSHSDFKLYGEDKLIEKLAPYRRAGNQKDCVVALSGGRDSCYGLHKIVKDYGMKPVTYTYDWGVVADLARRNVSRMCSKLGVENIVISADIAWKRENIRKNVAAWLKKPHLGMIPLFMAGDKQFIWYASQIRKQEGIDLEIFSFNQFEKSQFKEEYTGVQMWKPGVDNDKMGEDLAFLNRIKLGLFYSKEFLTNPGYLNRSLLDTFKGYWYFYYAAKDFVPLFHYIPWVEKECDDTLIGEYGWELATDTPSTWRIGDGTASFYNYIYYMVGGFTEFDTFRSNQVREGRLTREEALELVKRDNKPRWDSLKWYCDIINIDFNEAVRVVNNMPKTTPKLNVIM